jgi:DNA (cytosine-5)-methyltransferase 1
VDPRRYPWTNVLWASPECTNHSQVKGRKRNVDAMPDLFGDTLPDEAAERSRATMWDVVRFAEHHRYDAIVVENVVYAALWVLWQAWRAGLDALGYCARRLPEFDARPGGRAPGAAVPRPAVRRGAPAQDHLPRSEPVDPADGLLRRL